jgi:hypothetical protein
MKSTSLLSLLALATLAGCGKADTSTASLPAPAAAVVPAVVAAAPPSPAGVNGQPVEACTLLDAEVAAQSLGALVAAPESQAAQGSLLGGCNYMGENGILMLSARPASEYTATVAYAERNGGARTLEGLPGAASLTSVGLMLQPAGRPYFLVVYPLVSGKFDEGVAQQLARNLKF